jgi:hypothetical protein
VQITCKTLSAYPKRNEKRYVAFEVLTAVVLNVSISEIYRCAIIGSEDDTFL